MIRIIRTKKTRSRGRCENVETKRRGMSAYHIVLIKFNDPGKLLIIRRDKSADHRYLLKSDISRRRLIIKSQSPVLGGLCEVLAAIHLHNYAMGSLVFREESITGQRSRFSHP